VNDQLIDEVSSHFTRIAEEENFPIGRANEYDAFHYKHQIPGGMLSNMISQLKAAGIENRYNEVLEEISRIREELAWPIMVTPFSQLVGTQAVFNVINGERYKVVADEVKKYVMGHYGELISPIDQNIKDEERRLRYLIKGNHVDEMKKAGSIKTNNCDIDSNSPLNLLKKLTEKQDFGYLKIVNGNTKIKLGADK